MPTTAQPVLTPRRDLIRAIVLTLGLGTLLAVGFLPTSRDFMDYLLSVVGYRGRSRETWLLMGFPLLALFFHLSLSRRKDSPMPRTDHMLWLTLPVPCLISLLYGVARHAPGVASEWSTAHGRMELTWFLCLAPLGEEWLFRGWVYTVVDRLWPESIPSPSNALPLAVWASASAFSLWHWQNLGFEPTGIVIYQAVYTFLTGLWLGYLRQRTGKLGPGMVAHIALNVAANLLPVTPGVF